MHSYVHASFVSRLELALDFQPLHTSMYFVFWLFVLVGAAATIWMLLSVRRSYQRYLAASIRKLSYSAIILRCVIDAILYGIEGDIVVACILLASIPVWVWILLLSKDEDDWFNRQYKRLKKGWKKLRSWRPRMPRVISPLPAPSP